jgi:hypothetical protein
MQRKNQVLTIFWDAKNSQAQEIWLRKIQLLIVLLE